MTHFHIVKLRARRPRSAAWTAAAFAAAAAARTFTGRVRVQRAGQLSFGDGLSRASRATGEDYLGMCGMRIRGQRLQRTIPGRRRFGSTPIKPRDAECEVIRHGGLTRGGHVSLESGSACGALAARPRGGRPIHNERKTVWVFQRGSTLPSAIRARGARDRFYTPRKGIDRARVQDGGRRIPPSRALIRHASGMSEAHRSRRDRGKNRCNTRARMGGSTSQQIK